METAEIPETVNTISKLTRSSPISSPSSFPSLPGAPDLNRSGSQASSGVANTGVAAGPGNWPANVLPQSSTGADRNARLSTLPQIAPGAPGSFAALQGHAQTQHSPQANQANQANSQANLQGNSQTNSQTNSHANSPQTAAVAQSQFQSQSQSQSHVKSAQDQPQGSHHPTPGQPESAPAGPVRRSSFGLGFLSLFANSIRSQGTAPTGGSTEAFMSNSPTIANLNHHLNSDSQSEFEDAVRGPEQLNEENEENAYNGAGATTRTNSGVGAASGAGNVSGASGAAAAAHSSGGPAGMDKDGCYSIRLTPLIDHSSSTSGLYFAPVIRKIKPEKSISIGRYTDKNRAAAHAPQGSSSPIVFKSKVVSRTHALFQCNEEGQWFIKDCKSSSGTFLNHIRLSPASQELALTPLVDGDIVQLGMDYRGGTEEVYRCVKMRCEFNKSWQRKVNLFNLEIHSKLKNLALDNGTLIPEPIITNNFSECAICLLTLDPCQALFISPCSHAWHYKCIRPIIIKSYPQFYCPNCRSMCDLESDIEDDDD